MFYKGTEMQSVSKFQSDFNVDKDISKIITLRSLLPMYYCV